MRGADAVGRIRLIQWALGAGLCAVVLRAAHVQLVRGEHYRREAQAQRTERVVLPAPRGTIYDRNGTPLALSREAYHVGIAPRELAASERQLRVMARHLGVSDAALARELRKNYAYFHGPYSAAAVRPLRGMRGVHLSAEMERFYPRPEFARPLLGYPGFEGRPAGGIERSMDSLLSGIDGSAVVLRDSRGRRYQSPSRLDAFPVPGHDVYLTIDAELQDIVEAALAEAIETYDASGGDVVVLRPQTGEVLAVASRRADGSLPPSAFTTVFEPGSTAKIFVAAALLEYGVAGPYDSVFGERGRYVQGSRVIVDDHPEGWMSLARVIEVSSNIGIVKFAGRLSPEQQYRMLRAFGLGTPTGVEFPAEARGMLPRPDQWSGLTQSSLAMGYELAVTPLQLAAAYGAIANDGVLMRPTLISEVRAPNGKTVYRQVPEPVRRVVRPEVAAALRSMLTGVVYHGGTGSTAALTTYSLAGKTGTAHRAGGGGYLRGAYTATFASLFPAEQPQLVMVVKIDDPKSVYARLSAAPVTRTVIEQILAARTAVLDLGALATRPAASSDVPVGMGSVPYVVGWPPRDSTPEQPDRPVPDVRGMTLRQAARVLHQAGFRVRVAGFGTVSEMSPAPGTIRSMGSTVTLTARRFN
ncbi:Penicillin-binding protein PbpB [bacterium HR33]|nr:Penicillin-binding protein PbpB [bacterium HR33]